MTLTVVYYNSYFCGTLKTLHAPRSSILLPGNHFVVLGGGGGGGGGVNSGHKYKIQLNVPPFFIAELRCKRGGGAYNQASTVNVTASEACSQRLQECAHE